MKKLSKKKWLIVIVIFTILLILKDPIYDYLTFEQDVEDLAHFGIEKIQEIKNSLNWNNEQIFKTLTLAGFNDEQAQYAVDNIS